MNDDDAALMASVLAVLQLQSNWMQALQDAVLSLLPQPAPLPAPRRPALRLVASSEGASDATG